ncbi:VF530 family DNA-binding protein [Arenicella xantha]|uniref:Uncharacterized protein (DUF2132 family) n=1 Tax=Arenicella xantha TaxID=644221 RepID=A0A395JN15_9GAMM|nr:VF530 family DNA-binding protein [Arenicella xantha]RBP51008.1 uncharacterized protein (DUF2132 family) [Arenicella xantha]
MKSHLQNHPLNGIKLNALLTELVDHYGWDVLAGQININCFTSYPSIKSSLTFLRKTPWARQRVEAFYLYQYCQYPRPSDEEHTLPPRERTIDMSAGRGEPAVLTVDDAEFFDDPASGPVFPSKRQVLATQTKSKQASTPAHQPVSRRATQSESAGSGVDVTALDEQTEMDANVETAEEYVTAERVSSADTVPPAETGTVDPWAKARTKLTASPQGDEAE